MKKVKQFKSDVDRGGFVFWLECGHVVRLKKFRTRVICPFCEAKDTDTLSDNFLNVLVELSKISGVKAVFSIENIDGNPVLSYSVNADAVAISQIGASCDGLIRDVEYLIKHVRVDLCTKV